jgi:hypothetical protein
MTLIGKTFNAKGNKYIISKYNSKYGTYTYNQLDKNNKPSFANKQYGYASEETIKKLLDKFGTANIKKTDNNEKALISVTLDNKQADNSDIIRDIVNSVFNKINNIVTVTVYQPNSNYQYKQEEYITGNSKYQWNRVWRSDKYNNGYKIGTGAFMDWNDSDGSVLLPNMKVVISTPLKIENPQKINQKFKDSFNMVDFFKDYTDGNNEVKKPQTKKILEHCFLTPIIKAYEDKLFWAKAKKTQLNMKNILNFLYKKQIEYENGIPEKNIQEVCDKIGCCISVNNILNETYLNFKPETKRKGETFNFINTRANHVELNKLVYDSHPIMLNETQMKLKITELINNKEFFIFSGQQKCPNIINTNCCKYQLVNNDKEIYEKFLDKTNIKQCLFNHYDDVEFSNYVRSGCHFSNFKLFKNYQNDYNNASNEFDTKNDLNNDFRERYPNINEYDMVKAYTQHKESKYYELLKFPSIINHCRKVIINKADNKKFLINNVGVFTIKNINYDNVKLNVKKILLEYGYMQNSNITLPNPDLLFLLDVGATFDIIHGAWAVKKIDFEYSDDMLNNKLYVKLAGKLCQLNEYSAFKFITSDDKFVSHCKTLFTDANYDEYTKELTIKKQKKFNMWAPHISAFITSYTRINVLEKLINVKFCDIIGVKLDSIILKNNYDDAFKSKIWTKKQINMSCSWTPRMVCIDSDGYADIFGESTKFLHDMVLTGQGGSGKTTTICNDKGFRDILFGSFCWKLITTKMMEHNIKGTTINSLAGIDTEAYHIRHKHPAIIFIDEITMINKKHIMNVIENYPFSQIFLCGDIDKYGHYQCTISDIDIIKIEDVPEFKTHEFTTDFRAKDCARLQKVKLDLRNIVRNCFKNGSCIRQCIADQKEYLTKNLRDRFVNGTEIISNYNLNRVILASTHKQCEEYTKILKDFEPKYIMKSHSYSDLLKRLAGQEYYLNGEIVLTKPNNGTFKVSHCFTIHSFQGLTVKDNIYLDFSKLKDLNHIYTAISRAQSINNIYISI